MCKMAKTKTLTIELTSAEYGELLAKLANELEIYDDEASDELLNVFITLAREDLFKNYYETILIKKWKEKLFTYVPK